MQTHYTNCPITELTKKLIQKASISPNDAGCQAIIIERLKKIGFNIETMNFKNTHNLWAYRGNSSSKKNLLFAGHTDVVPPGNVNNWNNPPFAGILEENKLYGRGSSDMKGALAAMIVATEKFIQKYPNHQGKIAFLITSDEEDKAINGTKKAIEILINRKEIIDYCIIGEPSNTHQIGDTIKNGRRGSLTGTITIYGIQSHVAYPHLGDNPIHSAISLLNNLISIKWDDGDNYFPPTTMQITNLHGGIGKNNITPDKLIIKLNYRFNNISNDVYISKTIENLLKLEKIKYKIKWNTPIIQPYFSNAGKLAHATINAIKQYTNIIPQIQTSGGTSDGRFIIKLASEIIELGLINKTIHKINEFTKIKDLQLLCKIYQKIIESLIL